MYVSPNSIKFAKNISLWKWHELLLRSFRTENIACDWYVGGGVRVDVKTMFAYNITFLFYEMQLLISSHRGTFKNDTT